MKSELLRVVSSVFLLAGALEMAIGFGGSEPSVMIGSLGVMNLLLGV